MLFKKIIPVFSENPTRPVTKELVHTVFTGLSTFNLHMDLNHLFFLNENVCGQRNRLTLRDVPVC